MLVERGAVISSLSQKLRLLWSHGSILTMLVCCSVILNLFLAREVRKLRNTATLLAETRKLNLNDVAQPLETVDLQGRPFSISYADSSLPTVLYIFTPDCHWCARNLENINGLAEQVKDRYRLIGISINGDGLGEYLAQNKLNFPVYHSPSDASRLAYDMVATPTTIVISKEGRVVRIWSGAYGTDRKEEIEHFLNIRLPGLTRL
jgi:peroxiredoxin